MPDFVIADSRGTLQVVPPENLKDAWEAFKQERLGSSRLDYRRRRTDVGVTPELYSWYYDFMCDLAEDIDAMPKRGTPRYDDYIDKLWKKEPILAGTVYGMIAKAQSKPWKIEGGRNGARRAARMLNSARYSYYKDGWSGFAGVSALDFYTTRMGFVWGTQRLGNKSYGQLVGLEHIDALACTLTGSVTHPIRYISPETGQQLKFRLGEVIQENSVTLSREKEMGYGFCAVERAIYAIQLLLGLHDYDIEKLNNLPPEGVAAIKGITQDEFRDALEMWKAARQADRSTTFPQVLWLLGIDSPSERLEVQMTPFSTLPEQFNRQVVVEQYVNILANAFGISASDIWFMGGGPFGTGREAELQHTYARGKGEGEWFSKTEQIINRELPTNVEFSYDTADIEEDLSAAQAAKAWVEALLPLVEQSQTFGITPDKWMQLFTEKGVLPEWMSPDSEIPTPQILIRSDQTQLMSKEINDARIAFLWEAGRLHERPVITFKEGPGRGWHGPPKGTHTAQNVPGGDKKDLSSLSREKLESRGYIPVFRGVGPKGLGEMRPSSEGQLGPGIYFYDSPMNARAYAEPGGGIITAFVKPGQAGIKIEKVPATMFEPEHRIVVAANRDLVVRRGTIPTEKTVLQGYGKKARDAFEAIANAALDEHKEVEFKQDDRPNGHNIRGTPIPDHEVERGARVTRAAIEAERAIWADIPELQQVIADE